MVKKYKHHGHPFQKWLNTTIHKNNIRTEALAAMSGLNHSSILEWRKGASFPKTIAFWALCRSFALIEKTTPQAIASNVLPFFNDDTRDPNIPIWKN
tara:strand:- start:461 stop:751 length:291 start_codon:yes stop_codon:yes gene_type:complete